MENRVYVIHDYQKKLDLIKKLKVPVIDFMNINNIYVAEASKRIGVSRPTLDRILCFDERMVECLKVIPYLRTLVKIARFLNVDV